MVDWTIEDSDAAIAQGWCVFYSKGSVDGDWQIQRIDEPEEGGKHFPHDQAAWEFVYIQFLVGSKLANKALMFISENCMEEFQRIKKHCESSFAGTLYNPT